MNTIKILKIFLKLKIQEMGEIVRSSVIFRLIVAYLLWMSFSVYAIFSKNTFLGDIIVTVSLFILSIAFLYVGYCIVSEFIKWIGDNWKKAKRMANSQ